MSFKPYSDYRARTNRYLPSVPSHWEATRFKLFAEEREERSTDGNELLLSVSEYSGVSPRSTIVDEGDHLSRAESLEGYKVCHSGDLVMNIMLAWKKAQGVSDYHGIVSPAYSVYALRGKANPRFIHYLARTQIYADYFKSFSSGVIDSRLRLYPDTFLGLKTDLPPEKEQSSIASFLDRETAKIDALIAEQQRLIELLQEKRQAVISHAVTKGLNPNAPMKESGVEWLGEVPEHWEVKRVKQCIDPARPVTYGILKPGEPDENGMPMIRAQDYSGEWKPKEEILMVSAETEAPYIRSRVSAGDVLITAVGAGTGNCAVIPDYLAGSNISRASCRVSVDNRKLSSSYLLFVLSSTATKTTIELSMRGAAQPVLNNSEVENLLVPLPPLEEQSQLVQVLGAQVQRLDKEQGLALRQVELLQERRSAIISAAVTGQIDVRGLATKEEP